MKETFADTFYFLALLNPRDQAHRQASEIGQSLEGRLITSEYVLIEVGDAMARPADRFRFLALVETLKSDPNVEIVACDTQLLLDGIELYRNRADKDWPLTDCVSFVIMTRHGITDALTGDVHFRQAGFIRKRPLMGRVVSLYVHRVFSGLRHSCSVGETSVKKRNVVRFVATNSAANLVPCNHGNSKHGLADDEHWLFPFVVPEVTPAEFPATNLQNVRTELLSQS